MFKSLWSKIVAGVAAIGAVIGITTVINNNGSNTETTEVNSAPVVENSIAVKKQFFGVNGQINFNRVSYNDSAFMKSADSLNVDFVRIPGGTYAEQYNYLVDTPSLYSVAMFKNYVGCKIILVLNTATSTLQNQIGMLKLAHDLKIFTDTGFFEIGNEFVEPHDDNFLNKCKAWNDAILKIYPNAQIGIPGGAPRKWNARVLDKMPNVYIVDHYANPKDYVVNGITDTNAISKMMDDDRNTMFGGIPGNKIWVTEFNLVPANNNPQNFANDEQKKIAVKFMFKKFKSYGFPIILFHNIAMAQGNGAIESDAKGSRLSVTGNAIREYINSEK